MYTTADFLGRSVLTISEGVNWGKIVSFCFDEKIKNLTHFIVGKADSDYYSVPVKAVFKKENDAVMIPDASEFKEVSKPFNPVKLPVYGTSGTLTDKIKDVHFDEKFRVTEIMGEQRSFFPKEIVSTSLDTIIIKDCKVPRKKTSGVSRAGKAKVIMPNAITGNFSFLVGRRADKTIFDRRNEILIKKNAVITHDTIKKARTNGKLLELSLHAEK